ncbi:MAG: malto-oligosyltrehalose trehalohydrolase [Nitrospirota bacterium]
MELGAHYRGDGRCDFIVWAPLLKKVEVKLLAPEERLIPMTNNGDGYWRVSAEEVYPGARYLYRIDRELERPDPVSSFQPMGVHGPSQVVDHRSFQWEDSDWKMPDLCRMIVYEIHVGTFTPEGTFDAAVARLDEIKDLGATALLIMPVAQCPGARNWGYDGAYPFAVQNTYGGPDGLKRLVNECHKRGMAVKLDVVYNHFGPEGAYLRDFGPYLTDNYKSPWGEAINVDGPYSDGVRNFFIENALHWYNNFHIDILRLDAADRIFDINAYPFLQELADTVKNCSRRNGRECFLIAEADQNDPKLTRPKEQGGFGLDGQWLDDFHHCIHTLLTGEREGYYADYGSVEQLAKSLQEGFVYTGEYSKYRKCRRGRPSTDIPAFRFVAFSQNHDQIGNRQAGERLEELIHFEALKIAAATVLLSPFIPLLFMGQEYAEESPFRYFVNHSDPALIEAVRAGRKSEFTSFLWEGEPPDPESEETFLRSKLKWERRELPQHREMLAFYKALIHLRKTIPALSNCDKDRLVTRVLDDKCILLMRRWHDKERSHAFCIFNYNTVDTRFYTGDFLPEGRWKKLIDSAESQWNGPGTRLPDEINAAEALLVKEHAMALYTKD